MRHYRSLRSRLFSWFLGAIVLAMVTSAFVVVTTRPEPIAGAETFAQNVSLRLARDWDDPEARRAFVAEVRDVTGFDVRLVHDPRAVPKHVHRVAERGGVIAPDGPTRIFVPVVRDGIVVGALQMDRFGPRPAPWAWWRFGLALLLVMIVLSAMAGRVSNQLSRPLERLAHAADRFGGGDLSFRTDVGNTWESRWRWVAREVRAVAVSFNRMADRVEAMVRGQRELLGAISHELRSPLGRARVALEIARDRIGADSAGSATGDESAIGQSGPAEADDDAGRGTSAADASPERALEDVEKQLGAIDSILGELLDVTRVGLTDLRKEPRPLVPWLTERIADEPAPPVIRLHVAADPGDLVLPFDAALLGRAVHNLLVNARAHGHPPDRPLDVTVARLADRVRVAVRDRGPGFPPGVADRAFEPFVRGDAARARPSAGAGYGLGLTIVRRVVEAHGGRVFAANAAEGDARDGPPGPGGGATGAEVGFELPIDLRGAFARTAGISIA